MESLLKPVDTIDEKNTQEDSHISNEDMINNCLEKDIKCIYNKPWFKLERGCKIFKLKEYIKLNNLNESEIITHFNSGVFNKKNCINYDIENEKIINISYITINEDGTYSINIPKKFKARINNKSKSNIERIIKSKS